MRGVKKKNSNNNSQDKQTNNFWFEFLFFLKSNLIFRQKDMTHTKNMEKEVKGLKGKKEEH